VATTARKVGYFHVSAADKPGEGARILAALRDGGVDLLAFHAFPTGSGKSQLDFVPVDERSFQEAAKKAKVTISDRKTAILLEGDDRPGAVAELLQKLATAGTNITALDAVKAGQRFGALLWVAPADVDKAAKALGAQ
jgi:hypothetical protein